MTRAATMLALAAACLGCAEAHTLPDAASHPADAGVDAGRDRDAGAPDAWMCPDRDGDGSSDARCGGDDCDDDDPTLSPTRGPCVDATHVVRCVGGARANVACAAELPECDARDGECVAAGAACGDGVVHRSEDCDDANEELRDGCDLECRFGFCPYDAECRVPGAPWCIRFDDTSAPVCSPGNPGGNPLGARCDADAECESGRCGPFDQRCTFFCYDTPRCIERGGWCDLGLVQGPGYGGLVHDSTRASLTCVWPCDGPDDCGEDEACTVAGALLAYEDGREGAGVTYCAPIAGSLPAGAACTSAEECSTNVCREGACTRVCASDADCADLAGWECASAENLARRSPPFSTPYVLVCRRSDA